MLLIHSSSSVFWSKRPNIVDKYCWDGTGIRILKRCFRCIEKVVITRLGFILIIGDLVGTDISGGGYTVGWKGNWIFITRCQCTWVCILRVHEGINGDVSVSSWHFTPS